MHTTSDLSIYILITRPDSNPDVYIRFYSLNGFKKDTAKPHPAAAFPFIRLHTVGSGEPTGVYAIQIFGQYVIVESWVQMEAICSYTIDVYNWKTGQLVSVRVSASLRMNVEKAVLDGIQIWVDDASQWSEKTFGNGARSSKTSTNTSPTTTRNPSLIGSRYFVQRTGSGATESDLASTLGPRDNNQEFVVKTVVSEGKQAFDCCV